MIELTREGTRKHIGFAQMNHPTEDQIVLLHGCIARRLIQYGGMRDTLRVAKVKGQEIQCKSYYFDDRQAVTFEDGFVGIAGWADDGNVQPFLNALNDWVLEVTGHVEP